MSLVTLACTTPVFMKRSHVAKISEMHVNTSDGTCLTLIWDGNRRSNINQRSYYYTNSAHLNLDVEMLKALMLEDEENGESSNPVSV